MIIAQLQVGITKDLTRTTRRVFDLSIPNITYRNGPIDAGFILNWVFRHRGGEGIINPAVTTRTATTAYSTDYGEQYGGAYFKYNNGRFFLNAEYDFDREQENRSYCNSGTSHRTHQSILITIQGQLSLERFAARPKSQL